MDRNVDFRALVIDYATPKPDQDAGSYAAIQEVTLLQELGCKVTFIPNNFAHMGKHTEALQRRGVECIHAPFYTGINDYLQSCGRNFDLVYITRYDIAEQVIEGIRKHTKAKIVFNNADLHFLRELRAALRSGESSLDGPVRTRDRELSIMRDVDAVLSYNEVEHSVIASHNLTEENVFKCPWVLHDRRSTVPFADRSGVAFLGGYGHPPNIEAVKYFVKEVMPLLRKSQPGIKFHIYGSRVTEDIEALACEDVVVEGFVESLSDVFDTCRVFVAPLLSGAGIKGKVLESIAYGVPTVLSPIAAEATGLAHDHSTFIAESPEQWRTWIDELYTNEKTWKRMAVNSNALVETEYGVEKGLKRMGKVMEYIELDPAEKLAPLFLR
jgi:glycosyltransferase involved in cell wall biosynthesis